MPRTRGKAPRWPTSGTSCTQLARAPASGLATANSASIAKTWGGIRGTTTQNAGAFAVSEQLLRKYYVREVRTSPINHVSRRAHPAHIFLLNNTEDNLQKRIAHSPVSQTRDTRRTTAHAHPVYFGVETEGKQESPYRITYQNAGG